MHHLIEKLKKERKPVHDKCLGFGFSDDEKKSLKIPMCTRVELYDENKGGSDNGSITAFCSTYTDPANKWAYNKRCPLSDHFRPDLVEKDKERTRVGQQKQKKKT